MNALTKEMALELKGDDKDFNFHEFIDQYQGELDGDFMHICDMMYCSHSMLTYSLVDSIAVPCGPGWRCFVLRDIAPCQSTRQMRVMSHILRRTLMARAS